jgi:hypothetical protein
MRQLPCLEVLITVHTASEAQGVPIETGRNFVPEGCCTQLLLKVRHGDMLKFQSV